ncbi:MAG: 1,4-alpha-glucan branching protein GlgB [Methyloceanibacter sp.]|uniref:1,4-alpha-glucan branching protein GlgB n=1 Tax=Methyloceanibacter sp. TaxID=1965321 RepID=UPI003D6CF542
MRTEPKRNQVTLAVEKRANNWAPSRGGLEAIVRGEHRDPFSILGLHRGRYGASVRVFLPGAKAVSVVDPQSGDAFALDKLHRAGFFGGKVPKNFPRDYRLRVTHDAATAEVDDPYRFGPILGELDLHLLAEGNHLRLYEKMGAHAITHEDVAGISFAVWAPNAWRVGVVGPFNQWDGRRHVMRKRTETGVWEIFIPGLGVGELYKYELLGPNKELLPLKADPFAFQQEHPPATASVVHGLPRRPTPIGSWRSQREKLHAIDAPISIYEVHLGSWMRGEDGRFLSYMEIADRLIPYVRDLGFTHIELMPVSEFPFDGSWGYQPIGLYAPTSRFGTPEDLATFVSRCHEAGIGVFVDWVSAHFPADAHGLGRFDGTALYEHEDPRLGFHRDWNTLIYNYGRREVLNFLLANALFWLERYGIDGLRVDAVASMLYLDYSREDGDWIPNRYGGNENLEAIAFLKRLNELVFAERPGTTTIAEESTAWPGVSRPTYLDGLGFGFKWNMGWMHDTLSYMQKEPIHRRHHHDQLTFGLLYAFSENFVLPLSHDEVVHGKGSLIGKMPGDLWQRFANLRAYFGFMWGHPGKKLLFMGGEFAQEAEWSHERSLDWHLLGDDMHRGVQSLVRDLNRLYQTTPALHVYDAESRGFEWVEAGDRDASVVSFLRWGREGDVPVLVVCNFTPVPRQNYRVGVPRPRRWIERINTDSKDYGGSGMGNGGEVAASATACHGRSHSLTLTLPPLATLILEHAG